MWILEKKVIVNDLQELAYFSETSDATLNRDISAAKEFKTEAQALEFIAAHALKEWHPIQYNDPGATALQPWELEK
jgi:hypothetical protein